MLSKAEGRGEDEMRCELKALSKTQGEKLNAELE